MAHELSSNEELLKANQFGKFIHQNLALATFKRSKEDWRQVLDSQAKKSEIAKDFLADLNLKRKLPSDASPTAKKVKQDDFVVDKVGDHGFDEEKVDVKEEKEKKKKKKAKSYLDDL